MALSSGRNLQKNYVPRIVCADLRLKLGEQTWLPYACFVLINFETLCYMYKAKFLSCYHMFEVAVPIDSNQWPVFVWLSTDHWLTNTNRYHYLIIDWSIGFRIIDFHWLDTWEQ